MLGFAFTGLTYFRLTKSEECRGKKKWFLSSVLVGLIYWDFLVFMNWELSFGWFDLLRFTCVYLGNLIEVFWRLTKMAWFIFGWLTEISRLLLYDWKLRILRRIYKGCLHTLLLISDLSFLFLTKHCDIDPWQVPWSRRHRSWWI